MTEDITPEVTPIGDVQEALSNIHSMFSGGVINPLLKEQTRIEVPPVHPMPQLPGSQIPKLSGEYQGDLDSPQKYAMALKNHIENPQSYARDQYKYGKNYAYDADYTGLNFQRYYNAPRVFKQVGFSPWRDNEKIYNEKMTWWDSFKRSAGQSGHLMSTGFSSMLPWNAWNGDDTDEKSAKDMERAHVIGADNKGGVGGFMNNLMLDAGYTLGIGAEFAAEELALWGATALTGGAAANVAITRTGANAARLADKLGGASKIMTKLNEGLKGLQDISKTRNIFSAVKEGKGVEAVMNILTPSTFKFAQQSGKAIKTGENIYNLAHAAKGVGAFYRDAREIAAVLSESKLEGGSTELDMRSQLTDSFYRDNGRMPNATEYQQIFQHAADAGRETYLWNLPALWISNKIVFDKAFKGIPGLQTFRKELSEGLAGKLVFNEAARKAGKDAWNVVATGMKADVASLFEKTAWAPNNLLRNTVGKLANYTNKNLTEALQEQYQDAISNSMKEYYTDRYKHPGRTAMHESWGDIFARSVGKQFTTKQGWETFASGFLMGSLVQVPQHIVYDAAPKKFYQLTDPVGFAKFKADRETRTNNVVEALNLITKDPQKFFNPNITNAVSQGILNDHAVEAATNGDTKQFTDIKDESVFEHLHTLLQTDKLGLVTDYLKDMKSLSSEELEQAYGKIDKAQGDPKAYYDKKIDSMLARADYIENRNKFIEDKYGNPFNPHKFSAGKESDKYYEEAIKWQGWEDAKKLAVFSSYSFDRTVERMKSIMNDISTDTPVANVTAHEFTLLFDPSLMSQESKVLRAEISSMKGIPGTARESGQKQKKLDALEDVMKSISYYRDVLKDHAKDEELTKVKKDMMKDALKNLHKSFGNYTKILAGLNNSHAFNDKVNAGFTKLKDYYHLKNDSTHLAYVVNMLENPDHFTFYASRASKVKDQMHENRVELFKESFQDKLKADDFNQLLNQIFELGAYIYPDEISNFREGKLPAHFYDVTTGDAVPAESDKYKKIMELVGKYEEANKPPVVEETAETGTTETVTETVVAEAAKVKLTSKTPISIIETEAPELLKDLIQSYRDLNRKLFEQGDEMLDSKALDKSDEEIKNSPLFKIHIGNPGKPSTIISEYNKKAGRTLEPEVIKGEATTKPETTTIIVSRAMRQQLVDLGYDDTNKFSYAEAKRIIEGKIKPGSEEAARVKAEVEAEQTKKNAGQNFLKSIQDELDNIKGITALGIYQKVIEDMVLESDLIGMGINTDIINEMIKKKRSELKISFDDIIEGEAIHVRRYGIMEVIEKGKDFIKLTKFGDPTGPIITIKQDEIPNQVDGREGMDDTTVAPTEAELKAIQDTAKTLDIVINDEEKRKALEKDAANKSEKDILDDLTDDNCITPPKE